MNSPSSQTRRSMSQLVQSGHLSERARLRPGQTEHLPLRSNSFIPVQSILPQIGITKQAVKKLEAIQMVRRQREHGKQVRAYHARPFRRSVNTRFQWSGKL
jgi:hypothetical protein